MTPSNDCGCGTKDEVLIWCWIHGYLTKPPTVHRDSSKRKCKPLRTRKTCVCGRTFLAKRSDARFCGQSCRRRAAKRGLTATDNQESCLQAIEHKEVTGTIFAEGSSMALPPTEGSATP